MPSAEEIIRHVDDDPNGIEWVSTEPSSQIEIVDPDTAWATQFAELADRIRGALGDSASPSTTSARPAFPAWPPSRSSTST